MSTIVKDKCALILLVLLIGQWLIIPFVYADIDTEDQKYLAAMQLFNQKHWDEARIAFQQFQQKFPKSRWKTGTQLRLADLEIDPFQSIQGYRRIIEQSGETEWIEDAKWGLALALFTHDQYQQALDYLNQIHPGCDWRYAYAIYLKGLCSLALKDYVKAETAFQQVIELYPNSEWSEVALIGIGESALAQKKVPEALTYFDRYLRDYPEGNFTQIVLLQKSNGLQDQGMNEEAKRILHELVTRYSDSYEAIKARDAFIEDVGKYTIQVGAFSKKEYAHKLVQQLRKKGYNAYILEAKSGEDIFCQVRIGSYTDRDFSEKIARNISQKENLPYLILPYVKPDTQ